MNVHRLVGTVCYDNGGEGERERVMSRVADFFSKRLAGSRKNGNTYNVFLSECRFVLGQEQSLGTTLAKLLPMRPPGATIAGDKCLL